MVWTPKGSSSIYDKTDKEWVRVHIGQHREQRVIKAGWEEQDRRTSWRLRENPSGKLANAVAPTLRGATPAAIFLSIMTPAMHAALCGSLPAEKYPYNTWIMTLAMRALLYHVPYPE